MSIEREPDRCAGVMTAMAEADSPSDGTAAEIFVVAGNRLRVLPDGQGRLAAILALIDGAERTLRVLYYIYTDDQAGRQVRDALLAARRRGVEVSLIIDGFGSSAGAEFFAPLEESGASICRFLPRYGRRYLLRNHQKLLLADAESVILGGFNIEDDYFGRGDAWRDLGLQLDGPAAGRLAGYYDALQQWTGRPNAKLRDLRATLKRWSERDGAVRWLLGGPTRRLSPWALAVKREMRGAGQLDMIAAYFAPNPSMLRRVGRVARQGGAARVMTAARSDNNATIAAARHCYARLLRRGVRIFEYQAAKLHTKLFVIDDAVHLGSANFDVRSLYLNLELMVRIEDAGFAAWMRRYVDVELSRATEVTPEMHSRAGWWQRLVWSAAYFVVAVLDGNVTRRLNFGIDGE